MKIIVVLHWIAYYEYSVGADWSGLTFFREIKAGTVTLLLGVIGECRRHQLNQVNPTLRE